MKVCESWYFFHAFLFCLSLFRVVLSNHTGLFHLFVGVIVLWAMYMSQALVIAVVIVCHMSLIVV